MPRIARCLVDGGYYHIVTRGIDRRKLFRCKQDFESFYKIIQEYLKKYKIYLLHYCLMSNHIHLLVKAEKGNDLPKFMQSLLQKYASKFRKKYKSVGFVFQNRYKSKLIDNDAYLLECARYIERNPLRAKIVTELSGYVWSSYSYYGKGKTDDIITLDNSLYSSLAQTAQGRQEAYVKYIFEERPYDYIVDKTFRIK
ncbi:MAG: transposase [Candidatus Omnitrophota bacterium]